MCPVPATKVKLHVVSGATIVTYLGLARMTPSAMRTRKSMPPAASITDAAMITARMISITSIGGDVGSTSKTTISTSSQTQTNARVARSQPDRREHDDELQDDRNGHCFLAPGRPGAPEIASALEPPL